MFLIFIIRPLLALFNRFLLSPRAKNCIEWNGKCICMILMQNKFSTRFILAKSHNFPCKMQRKLPPNVTDAAQTITNAQRKNCLIDESCTCGMAIFFMCRQIIIESNSYELFNRFKCKMHAHNWFVIDIHCFRLCVRLV